MDTLKPTDSLRVVEPDNVQPPPHYDPAKGPQVVTSDTARQGPLGKPVLWVLLAALVLVVVGFAAAFMFSGTPTAG